VNRPGHLAGLVVGLVVDLDDPEHLGRVRVKFPDMADAVSDWARLITPMAGKQRGLLSRPEVGDEVVLAFERGEGTAPYVLGGVWSRPDPPPEGGDQRKNDLRVIRSRSGHQIRLDDTPGSERVEILDKAGQRAVVLDTAGTKVIVRAGPGDVEVEAGANVRITGRQGISLTAPSITVEASGVLTLKGKSVQIN
jgi:uncharacterized protein involved in type VI secretion and phage assembly